MTQSEMHISTLTDIQIKPNTVWYETNMQCHYCKINGTIYVAQHQTIQQMPKNTNEVSRCKFQQTYLCQQLFNIQCCVVNKLTGACFILLCYLVTAIQYFHDKESQLYLDEVQLRAIILTTWMKLKIQAYSGIARVVVLVGDEICGWDRGARSVKHPLHMTKLCGVGAGRVSPICNGFQWWNPRKKFWNLACKMLHSGAYFDNEDKQN